MKLIELLLVITIIAFLAALSLKTISVSYKKSVKKINRLDRYHKGRIDYSLYDGAGDSKELQMRISKVHDSYLGYDHHWKPVDTNTYKKNGNLN